MGKRAWAIAYNSTEQLHLPSLVAAGYQVVGMSGCIQG